jgi:hypothetical protein
MFKGDFADTCAENLQQVMFDLSFAQLSTSLLLLFFKNTHCNTVEGSAITLA